MSSTKKLIDACDTIVDDAVEGLLLSNSDLARVENIPNVVVRKDIAVYKDQQVTIISGGGSGHEPAHAGFIGKGMISGAVCGNVFASPSVAQVLAAIRVCAGKHGVLLIIKNYTGDRLNFGIAMEKAKSEGFQVEMVVVADDAALPEGKAAASGASLQEVYNEAQELGLGIHGEPGREQRKVVQGSMASIVSDILVSEIMQRLPKSNESCALLFNNLGALPLMELLVVVNRVMCTAEKRGLKPVRAYVGFFMTSLEMSGMSLSILPISGKLMISRLDAMTDAPAWQNVSPLNVVGGKVLTNSVAYIQPAERSRTSGGTEVGSRFLVMTKAICESLIDIEPELTQCDTVCGDGDCGLVMKKGCQRVLADMHGYDMSSAGFCSCVADSLSVSMGGTSGALFEIFFRAAANSLSSSKGGDEFVASVLALQAGCRAIQFYGDGAVAAKAGSDATKNMEALAGRANYVNSQLMDGVPDPGSLAVATAFAAAASVYE
eukprot:GSChrysophyteH1.ASY1.ANO1.1464.1 assembled CDS